MEEINSKNYHEIKNKLKYLSNSDLKKFKEDMAKFKHVVIDGNSDYCYKEAFFTGSRVDDITTSDDYVFEDLYSPKVLKRDNKELFELNNKYLINNKKKVINPVIYNEIVDLANKIKSNDFYKNNCSKAQKQVVLKMPFELNHGFKGLCGMLDFLKIIDKTAIIIDLKTSKPFLPRQRYNECPDGYKGRCALAYMLRCQKYGYISQAGIYDKLVRYNYPEIEKVLFFHLTIEKVKDLYPISVIRFSQDTIDNGWSDIQDTIRQFNYTTDFHPYFSSKERIEFNSKDNFLTI